MRNTFGRLGGLVLVATSAATVAVGTRGLAASPAEVTTVAGSAEKGYRDGRASIARFDLPSGLAVDRAGNVYVADAFNYRVRKITPNGQVRTVAGSGTAGFADGPASVAQFSTVVGLAIRTTGELYVADPEANRIRKVDSRGSVTTVAGSGTEGYLDGPGTSARFSGPSGIAVDVAGNLYVADNYNHRIRKVNPDGIVSTFAGAGVTVLGDGTGISGSGDGPGATAQFRNPTSLAVDRTGNVFVADYNNSLIRKITPAGTVSTVAGTGDFGFVDGPGKNAQFSKPVDVDVDAIGNVYVADSSNYRIRMISPDGFVTTIAGSGTPGYADGPGTNARFGVITSLALDPTGRILYVAEDNRIRRITLRIAPAIRR